MDTFTVMLLVIAAFLAGTLLGLLVRRPPVTATDPVIAHDLARLEASLNQLGVRSAQQFGQVDTLLRSHGHVTQSLASSTSALREAMASTKVRGQWGERMADDVLRIAGMVENVNYVRQRTLDSGRVPDFTFLLPKGQVLHMDVKFPLSAYLRVLDAASDEERATHHQAFLRDVRLRVKELTDRSYHADRRSLGYVLLFLPNESVSAYIHEHDALLLEQALERNVVMCSPLSLFAVLGVVRQAFDNFMVEQTSDEVLRLLSGFRQQWQRYAASVDTLHRRFAAVHNEFEHLATTRRRQLERPLDELETLRGAVAPVEELRVVGE